MPSITDRLAVCSWSLKADSADNLIEQVRATGLSRVQLGLGPILNQPDAWKNTGQRLKDAGIAIASGMVGTVGENYSTLETIRQTGGIVPDATWPQTWERLQQAAPLAGQLGMKLVTFHAGFLPEDHKDPSFNKLIDRVRQIADLFAKQKVELGFETGQEKAAALKGFLQHLDRRDVGVNFDPANMILYASGDPIEALRTLGSHLKQVHIKDAVKTETPGTWGKEAVVGTGQVDWPAFLRTLDEVGFKGNLVIEREAGTTRVEDVKQAKQFIAKLAN
jgi:L-ribulose-5-phosphate 3-epimerase